MVTTEAQPDARVEQQEKKNRSPLRYQKRSLLLLAIYVPFLIVPWCLTCILAVQPLGLPSYYSHIYYSPGSPIHRPVKTLAATVTISGLIFLQLVGLLVLVFYIYSVPT